MGYILDPITGKPSFNDTASTQADFQAAVDYTEKVGNRRRGLSSDRTAFTSPTGLEYFETDTGATWVLTSTGWVRRQLVRLGRSRLAAALVVNNAAPTWMDVVTVNVTSTGGTMMADWRAVASNGNSGARQIALFRVTCDGNQVEDTLTSDLPLISGTSSQYTSSFEHELATGAGGHVWKLQVQCSIANAISVSNAVLIVNEV